MSDPSTTRPSTSEPAGPSGDADGDDPLKEGAEITLSPGMIVGAAVVLLIIAVLIVSVLGGDDEEPTGAPTPPAGAPAPGPTPPAGGPVKPGPMGVKPGGPVAPGVKPSVKPSFPKTTVTFPGRPGGEPTDDFDRANGPVGNGWKTTGTWEVVDKKLQAKDASDKTYSFALRDLPAADGSVTAVAAKPAGGGALVFRYTDPENYWVIQPVPQRKDWYLAKVEKGKSEIVVNVTTASTMPGTVLTVTLKGEKIELKINGKVMASESSPFNATSKTVGFREKQTGMAGAALWDDVYTS